MPRSAVRGQFGIFAFLCILSGVVLMLDNYGLMQGAHRLWPVFPLAIGCGFILIFFQRYRHDLKIMGIGTYLVGVSIFFFFCNYTSYSIVKRFWPVFLFLFGLSVLSVVPFSPRKLLYFAIAFALLSLSVVFFLVFAYDARLWPISLVFFGICIVLFMRVQ